MGSHLLEGRKREERVGGLGNVACCKTGTHLLEGRKREERVGELRNVARYKMRTHLLEGRKGGRGGVEGGLLEPLGNNTHRLGGGGRGGLGWGREQTRTREHTISPHGW